MTRMLLALALFASACGSAGAALPDAFVATISAVEVTPGSLTVKRGLSAPIQLTAKVSLSSSTTLDITNNATWTSSDATVATVSVTGVVTPVGSGTATITASYEDSSARSTVTVTSPKIFMAEAGSVPAITIFDAYASGEAPPLARITGNMTTLSFPWAVVVSHDEIYVGNAGSQSIAVWPVSASGDVPPIRELGGALTKLSSNYGMAVYNHEIYVAVPNEILVFPDTATGNVAPTREITGAMTGLTIYGYTIAIDHDELYVTNSNTNQILVFPVNASGNIAPTRKLTGVPSLGLMNVYDFKVADGELYVADLTGIRTYLSATDGPATPIRYVRGANTGLSSVIGVNIVGEELYSVNYSTGGIHVHPLKATGDVLPTRVIVGPATTISSPRYQFVY